MYSVRISNVLKDSASKAVSRGVGEKEKDKTIETIETCDDLN